ncbi:MAG: ubiquinone-binding protein [Candidatus Pelagibacter sp.]|nr:ubiquinone-binding protein [Candidatus Pelagibacter sp.]
MPKKKINKKFKYPLELIERLILDINQYKDFLPWCNDSRIVSKKEHGQILEIIADLEIGYSFVKDTYRSIVKYDNNKKIVVVHSIDGPLKKLENIWELEKINDLECEISFFINLELKNFLLNKMLSKMFDVGFDKIVKSFESRAEYLSKLK